MGKKIIIRTTPGKIAGGLAAGILTVVPPAAMYLSVAGMNGHEGWLGHNAGEELNGVFEKDYPAPTGYRVVNFDGTKDKYPCNMISEIARDSNLPIGYVDSEFDKLNPNLDFGKMQINDKYIIPLFQSAYQAE